MGGTFSAAGEKGVAPMRRLKQGGGSDAEEEEEEVHARNKETISIALSENSPEPHSLSPLCKPCHALPQENALPEGLAIDTTSLQEQKSYIQLVQENEKYRLLCEEADAKNCSLMEANDVYRQNIEQKDNYILGLERQVYKLERQYKEQIYLLNENLKVNEEKCRDMCLKIEMVEHLHSQQSIADSGSYQDSAATPPLLQIAADSVRDAITACASELFSRIKKNSLPINFAHMNLDSKETGQIIKVAVQSFLCQIVFTGFEDPFFSASDVLPPFVKPARRKAHFLQVYKRCRDLEARQMFNDETDFTHFFGVKESDLCMRVKEQLLMTDDVQKKEGFITSELRNRNKDYYSKLLRLLKAVWVLHKLAFAFEPSADIFRVGQDSVLDEEFMEDVAGDDDDDDQDDEKMAGSSTRRVKFMCVPGFSVRHTIIKSRVFSLKESQRPICSLMQDPSPMTVD